MVIRGQYSQNEKLMISYFQKEADKLQGWMNHLPRKVASEESIKGMAYAVDYWNPLWINEEYAANTRWGGIIAPPLYQDCISSFHFRYDVPSEVGIEVQKYIGEDWSIFKPIRINDSFRVWRRRSLLIDATDLRGSSPRKFIMIPHDLDHINQKDELVSSMKLYVENTYLSEPPKMERIFPEYEYTQQEIDFIQSLEEQEEIRGSNIRYWEDVNVGDSINPVVLGPTTFWDLINYYGGGRIPLRELRKISPGAVVTDPVTGVTHSDAEKHFSDRIAQLRGIPRAFHFGGLARQLMLRAVTNWMGDDGFIRYFSWRHMQQSFIGDTYIGRGEITDKSVKDDEYMVKIKVWLQNIRGYITETSIAVVSLCSRESLYKWK